MTVVMNMARINLLQCIRKNPILYFGPSCRNHNAHTCIVKCPPKHQCTDFLTDSIDQNYTQRRFYNKKKTLKIPPTKVLNFDYGGDLSYQDYPLDLQQPRLALDGAEKLKHCDEITRRLLSMEFADGHEKLRRRLQELVTRVQEHSLDVRSLEVIIAYQTVFIRNQVRHVLSFRKDKAAKSLLVLRLQAQRKHLTRLRAIDYDKFIWLCKELQMKYVPMPMYNQIVSKRAALKKAAHINAKNIISKKLEVFREQFLKDKEDYAAYRQQELAEIEKAMDGLELDDSSEIKKVFKALKHGDINTLDGNPVPLPTRGTLILNHKFKLAEIRAKEKSEKI